MQKLIRQLAVSVCFLIATGFAFAEYQQEYIVFASPETLADLQVSFQTRQEVELEAVPLPDWSTSHRVVVLVTFEGRRAEKGQLVFRMVDHTLRLPAPEPRRTQTIVIDLDNEVVTVVERGRHLPGSFARSLRRDKRLTSDQPVYGTILLGLSRNDVNTGGAGVLFQPQGNVFAAPGSDSIDATSAGVLIGVNTRSSLFGWKKTSELRFEVEIETRSGGATSVGTIMPGSGEAGYVLAFGQEVRGGVDLSANTDTRSRQLAAEITATWVHGSHARVTLMPRASLVLSERRLDLTSSAYSVACPTQGSQARVQNGDETLFGLGLGLQTAIPVGKRTSLDVEAMGYVLGRNATLETFEDASWCGGGFRVNLQDKDSESTLRGRVRVDLAYSVTPRYRVGARFSVDHTNKSLGIFTPLNAMQNRTTGIEATSETILGVGVFFKF